MADNILVTPGVGATIAADEIAGALHQRIKIVIGADGVNDGDVSATNPIPVVQTGTPALPTGAATAALQTQPGVDIGDVTINNAAGAAAVNIQDGGNSITVDGVFFQATQPVSIAATVAVSGPLTDAQLRAAAVPVSGTVTSNIGTIAGIATEVTSAAILAKLIANPATDTLQTSGNASLSSIDTKLTDNATQTTLAAVLAKLITNPATDTLQTAGNASLTTIAAKDFSTSAKQDTQITALNYLNREEAFNSQVHSSNTNITYFGYAAIGTATSAAAWKIFRLDETTGTVKKWADGDNSYDNIFDNREALTYV